MSTTHNAWLIRGDDCTAARIPYFFTTAMPRLTPIERERAVGRLAAGQPPDVVANAFRCHISTIYRLQERIRLFGTTNDRPRSGRPRVTSQRQDRWICRHHLCDRYANATHTAQDTIGTHQRPVSERTVRRRLNNRALYSRRPAVRPILTRRHRQARLQWARQHVVWNWRQWQNILFTDESRYCVSHGDGRIRIWRRRGERFSDACITEVNPWGGPGVMIWGGIGLNERVGPVFFQNLGAGRGNGVTAQVYINQVLQPHVVPHIQRCPNTILQQDNARPHTARATRLFLQQQNIPVMRWPAMSPDLNPVEHFWDQLQRDINRLRPRPATAAELQQAIVQAWRNIPQAAVNRLIHSMHRRCTAVIDAKGAHTRY